ncbi:MAG: ThiF family adenylyltransferase [Candidatus Bathyarchaeota archaeon]|nr:ThiF family adenylyltransferase [Candidatus Bathyarchaeota archaeon]MDH5734171.1 ThiF family adenylyltransferase [Candidatus Bathyarchaeota archaeon]
MNKIVIPKSIWERAKVYLQNDNCESFLFFFCGINKTLKSVTFLVRDFIRVQEKDIAVSDDYSTQVELNALLDITNRAHQENVAIVEAHNHPFSREHVTFSYTDHEGYKEFVPYILDYLKKPYGATVWSSESADGMMWTQSFTGCEEIHQIRILGKNITNYSTSSNREASKAKSNSLNRAHRQVLALGESGQEQIGRKSVALIGLGGIGSHVAQQLTYLGVRDFVLVDFDIIQTENLNRIVGAYPRDIGKSKVEIAARMIKSIAGNEKSRVVRLEKNLRHEDVLNHIKSCDVIFGCVDNDGARLILNELALAYMVPYFDSAFGIHAENRVIEEAGGRVILVLPDEPCLLCCKDIDISEASYFLASRKEQAFREERGYVSGAHVPSPSIISLDGIIASIAVTEFTALITGFREALQYSSYDFLKQQLNKRIVKKNTNCIHCNLAGFGDDSDIMRYAIQSNVENKIAVNSFAE